MITGAMSENDSSEQNLNALSLQTCLSFVFVFTLHKYKKTKLTVRFNVFTQTCSSATNA